MKIQTKNTGTLLKYILHKSTSSSFSIVASNTGEEAALEGEKTFSNVVQEARPASHTGEEVESSSPSDEKSAAQIIPSFSIKDIGLWPNKTDYNTRVFLVPQGSFAIQDLDADFSEGVKRPNNTIKAKGETRKGLKIVDRRKVFIVSAANCLIIFVKQVLIRKMVLTNGGNLIPKLVNMR